MNNTLAGLVEIIKPEEVKSEKFRFRELVIKTPGDYPQSVVFQFANDKGALLDDLTVGQEVTIHFNVRGRVWDGKHFVNLDGWKIDKSVSENTEKDLPF